MVYLVKPQIEPFNFNEINERKSLKVFCTVTGDLPLDIVWLKDDQTLVPTESRRVQRWDDFSVVLSLSTISVNDSGNYTCHAKNLAGEALFTSALYVKGQCRIFQYPLLLFLFFAVCLSIVERVASLVYKFYREIIPYITNIGYVICIRYSL